MGEWEESKVGDLLRLAAHVGVVLVLIALFIIWLEWYKSGVGIRAAKRRLRRVRRTRD